MTDGSKLRDQLAAVPLFSHLDAAELDRVASVVSPFEASSGHVLVQPGMVGAGLFLIEDGTVAASAHDRQLDLGPGEFFGELSLLDERAVRTMRVRATSPVRGYCIARDEFNALLKDEPKIAIAMLKVLAHRLVDLIAVH